MNAKNKKITLLAALLPALLLSCTACGTPKEEAGAQPERDTQVQEDTQQEENTASYGILSEGDAAPDFTAGLTDGTTFTLSGQQGKIVLLNFWATWCGPCVREMPAFEKLHEEYGEDISILAVNCLEDSGTVDAFVEENGYTFPIAYDTEGSVSAKYPSQGIPYTLVIDGDGIIQQIYLGAADADTQYQEYKGAIDAIIEADAP